MINKLLAGLVGAGIVIAVVAGCGGAGIPSTSTPTPPTVTPAPTEMRIGSWELLPELEGGAYSSIAIQTESVRGDSAVLRISCLPQSGTFVAVAFLDPFLTLAGPHEVRVSTGSSFASQVWDLLDSRRVFIPSDLFDHAGILSDLEGAQEFQFVADLEIDPERWTSFDVTGFREAEHQISPCDAGKAEFIPSPTSEPVPEITPEPANPPSPQVPVTPTATPAPTGTWFGEWKIEQSTDSDGDSSVALSSLSHDSSPYAYMLIGCTESGTPLVALRYSAPDTLVPQKVGQVTISTGGAEVTEDWLIVEGGRTLVSLNPNDTIEMFEPASAIHIEIELEDGTNQWSNFDTTRLADALEQVFPCDSAKATAFGGVAVGLDHSNPIPLRETGTVKNNSEDHWDISVLSVNPDPDRANIGSLGIGIKNDPPEDSQFFRARIQATNRGREASEFSTKGRLTAVGQEGRRYDTFSDRCGSLSDGFPYNQIISIGEIIEGDVCWEIASQDATSLLLAISPDDPFGSLIGFGYTYWFALHSEE